MIFNPIVVKSGAEFKVNVTVDSGALVTATKGQLTVSGTAVDGQCVLT